MPSLSRHLLSILSQRFSLKLIFKYLSKLTVDQLEQFYLLTPQKVKDAYLFYLLKDFKEKNPQSSVIVFTNTCR